MLTVISYDIVKDKRRNRVAKILLNYSIRVQYSVFECYENEEIVKKLIEDISKEINEKEDSVIFYRVCSSCENKIKVLGKEKKDDFEQDYIIV